MSHKLKFQHWRKEKLLLKKKIQHAFMNAIGASADVTTPPHLEGLVQANCELRRAQPLRQEVLGVTPPPHVRAAVNK